MVDLSVDLGKGLRLKNPILAASGTFGYGDEIADLVEIEQFGGIITKSLSWQPRVGNPPPRIVETSSGMINSIGLANIGLDAFLKEKASFLSQLECQVIINIAASTKSEFIEIIQALDREDWIAGYEINVSCPNVEEGGIAFGTNPKILYRLSAELRQKTGRFLIIKLTPNVTDIAPLAVAVQKSGADAISMINTLYGAAIDIYSYKPKISTVIGGLSGPAIKPVALALLIKARKAVDIPIVGIGGISCGADVVEFMLAGASAIQLGSVNFFNPLVIHETLDFLQQYLAKQKITSIRDIVGKARL
jgi:dihydroorotate dehydrogenase (NAD+) catalytic subunit